MTLTWNTGGNHPAVIGFFVLSGFCIHASHSQQTSPRPRADWNTYFRRRAKRILPVYWLASLLGLAFVILQTLSPAASRLLDFHAETSALDVVLRLGGLTGVYPKEVIAGNYILGTVATELVIYACYPLFMICARRDAWKTMAAVALISQLVIIQMVPFWSPFWVYASPPMMGAFWYAGALAAKWFFAKPRQISAIPCIACWVTFLAVRTLPVFYARNLLLQLLWCAVCVYGMLWLVSLEQSRPALRQHPWVRALGSSGLVSYSLYAVHTPVIMLTTWVLLKGPTSSQSYSLQLALTFSATMAVTLATYHLVERPYFRTKAKTVGLPITAASA